MVRLTVAVTLKDLAAAIAAPRFAVSVTERCVLAQALMRTTGATTARVGITTATVDGVLVNVPEDAIELAGLFDQGLFEELRARLQHPQVFAFEVRE